MILYCIIPSIQYFIKTNFYKAIPNEQEIIQKYKIIIESSLRISNILKKKHEIKEVSKIFVLIKKKKEILEQINYQEYESQM